MEIKKVDKMHSKIHQKIWEKYASLTKYMGAAYYLISIEWSFICNSPDILWNQSNRWHTHVHTTFLHDELYPPLCSNICCLTTDVIHILRQKEESYIQLKPRKDFYTNHKKQTSYLTGQIIQTCYIQTKKEKQKKC